jgi:hypothetical protein
MAAILPLRLVFSGRPTYLPAALALAWPGSVGGDGPHSLSCDRGEHVEQHAVNRFEHPRGEVVDHDGAR